MEARSLLAGIPRLVRGLVPPDLRDAEARSGFGLVKLHYGNPKIHYEANHQARSTSVEVGLHFEADGFTNARLIGAFRVHARLIARDLPNARIETWDKGWARVWEPVGYEALDRDLQRDVAERLARYIAVLEPLLRRELPADVPWTVAERRRAARGSRRG